MRDQFVSEVSLLAEQDPSIMLITGDLGFGVLTEFAQKFPNQFINAGVAEQNMTALACGLALEGRKVYTYSIGNFSTLRCLEQIRNDICYHDCDVTIVSVGAGFSYGQLGPSHFATEDLAILRALPNMAVVAPADSWETPLLVRQMAQIKGPKYLRLDKGNGNSPHMAEQVILGEPRYVSRGNDVTLISIGAILSEVIIASEQLKEKGITSNVITINCLKPANFEPVLDSIRSSKRVVCVEEHSAIGGLNSTIVEACVRSNITDFKLRTIAIEDSFPSVVGDQNYLRKLHGLSYEEIVNGVMLLF